MFEDLQVGDTHPGGLRESALLAAPSDPAALGAELSAWWRESRVEEDALLRRLSSECVVHREAPDKGQVELVTTLVRLSAERDGASGRVTWHHALRTASGEVLATATTTDLLRAQDATSRSAARDVGTLAWGRLLVERLADDTRFHDAVATWDGTIGLRSGDHTVEFRLYRGAVLEVTTRSLRGATFIFGADDRTWADVLTGPHTSFGVRLMRGDFTVTGDPYEYLRLTKALELVVDAARDLADAPAEVTR